MAFIPFCSSLASPNNGKDALRRSYSGNHGSVFKLSSRVAVTLGPPHLFSTSESEDVTVTVPNPPPLTSPAPRIHTLLCNSLT